MLFDFFKKLENSKRLRWAGMAPFILLPVFVMFGGEVGRGVVFLAAIVGTLVGGGLGGPLLVGLVKRFIPISGSIETRLKLAGSVFAFISLPVVVISLGNSYLATGIEHPPLGAHFLLACVISGMMFALNAGEAED